MTPLDTPSINEFAGKTVHIVGGGPSVKDIDPLSFGTDRVIAVNNSGLDVVPNADVLLVMDRRWFDWNRDRLGLNRSRWRFVRQEPTEPPPWPVIGFAQEKVHALSYTVSRLAGTTGGAAAINLAHLLGAKRIVLHGFEMRPGNYHDDHRVSAPDHLYRDVFIPSIEAMAPGLRLGGTEVFNATPGSALTCFPAMEATCRPT